MVTALRAEVPIERLEVAAYTVPTDRPESDGTLEWESTTIVVVDVSAGGAAGAACPEYRLNRSSSPARSPLGFYFDAVE
jgi:hypothetical protein